MNLLTEVRRIKEMMGFKTVLNEQWWKTLFGASDEAAEAFGKQAAEESSNLSKAFAEVVGGKGEWSDILKYAGEQTGKVGDETAAIAWIKTQPDLMKKIAMASDEIVNSVIKKKFTTMNLDQLFSDDSIKFLEELSNETLDDITADYIKSTSENLVKFIKQKPNWASNKDLSDLVKDLEARAKLADDLMNPSAVKGTTTDVATKALTKDEFVVKIDDMISNPSKYAKSQELQKDLMEAGSNLSKEQKDDIANGLSKLSDEEAETMLKNLNDKMCTLKENIRARKLLTEGGFVNFCREFASGIREFAGTGKGALGIVAILAIGYFIYVNWDGLHEAAYIESLDPNAEEKKKEEENNSSEEENNSSEEENNSSEEETQSGEERALEEL
jgi:hypothetical protein